MILPALTEATSPLFRPIKYSLFPPLGLATLAAYLDDSDEVTITDEHLEKPGIKDMEDRPELVVIQVYITRISIAGHPSRAVPAQRTPGQANCLTLLTPPAGKNSSRYGTSSSAHGESRRCCRCWKQY